MEPDERTRMLAWMPAHTALHDGGVLRLKRRGLKHFARSFPTVFSSRVSLALDLAKHGVTAVASVLALLAPSADSVIEFATLAASLASVCANGYRRYVLLRRSDEPPAPDEGKPRSSTGAASPVAFCVQINHWFGGSPPNFRTLYLGQFDVDSADFWTNRLLSSSSRSTAENLASKRSHMRTLKSG